VQNSKTCSPRICFPSSHTEGGWPPPASADSYLPGVGITFS